MRLNADKENNLNFSGLVTKSQNTIASMALLHEMLYANSNLTNISLAQYSASIFNQLKSTYSKQNIKLDLSIPPNFSLEIDKMISIRLIMNEVISNSFKYVFQKEKRKRKF